MKSAGLKLKVCYIDLSIHFIYKIISTSTEVKELSNNKTAEKLYTQVFHRGMYIMYTTHIGYVSFTCALCITYILTL